MDEWALPDEVTRNAPLYALNARELADLQLLISGALAPLTGFHTRADLSRIRSLGGSDERHGPPVPLTLEIPADVAHRLTESRRVVTLTDPEGSPLASLVAADTWPVRDGWYGVGGPVRAVGFGPHGTFRRLRRRPDEVVPTLPAGRVLGVIADRPLHRPQLAEIAYAARTIAAHILLLVPVGTPGPDGLPSEALVRCVLAARDRLPAATVVAVPLAGRGTGATLGHDTGTMPASGDEVADGLLRAAVARNYGATHLLAPNRVLASGGLRVLLPRELAYDARDGQWRSKDDIPRGGRRRVALTEKQIDAMLDRGTPLPEWHTPPAVAAELTRARPPRRVRGVVVFFTGLSGSGKSTIAREVADELSETGERRVTLIDGYAAKRYLSGTGYSRADRNRDVRRIGFVAAEAARHGGLALCCPIAPYARSRAVARQLAEQAGAGFVLVYVSTPLDVCESRDPKGMYARARSGHIPAMTGVDEPYEVPLDADLVVDTAEVSLAEAVDAVTGHLATEGWLDRR